MKTVLILSLVLVLGLFSVQEFGQAFGQAFNFQGLNHPGIKWKWKINTDNYDFIVNTTSNYDMQGVTLNKDTKTLTFLGNSTHTGNIAEIEIPSNLIGGNYTVYQNGIQISPIVLKNGNLTTIILKFNDTGKINTNIIGTKYLPEFAGMPTLIMIISFVSLFLTFRLRKI